MKLELIIRNEKGEEIKRDFFNCKIESCYSPHNLWLIHNFYDTQTGENLNKFLYNKIQAIYNVIIEIDNHKIHAKVADIATGNYNYISHIYLDHEGDTFLNIANADDPASSSTTDYYHAQTYIIDLDELKSYNGYEKLSIDECFAKLLYGKGISYEIMNERYITQTGRILNYEEFYSTYQENNK